MDIASDLERYMLELVNAERTALGLAPLKLELNLNTSADQHSQWMTDTDTFSHSGVGGSTMTDRIVDADFDLTGTWRTAENIAAVTVSGTGSLYDEVDRLHANLMDSPTHRANILSADAQYLGIGLVLGNLTYGSGNTRESLIVTQNFASTSTGTVDLDLAGGLGNDRLIGGKGDDYMSGGKGNDQFTPGEGNDTILGGDGNDSIYAATGAGTKGIDGGSGTDVLVLGLNQSDVQFTITNGLLNVATARGKLSLDNIEYLQFDDGKVNVADLEAALLSPTIAIQSGGAANNRLVGGMGRDLILGGGGTDTLIGGAGNDVILAEARGIYGTDASAQVYRLFDTVFGREPGVDGHHNFAARLAAGATSLTDLADGFVNSAEFQIVYGSLNNAQFVTMLFQNVLGRPPAQAGLDAWVSLLENGQSRASVVEAFSETAEHQIRTRAALEEFEGHHDQTAWIDDVYRLFEAVLDRPPAENGLNAWSESLANGTDFDTVLTQFMNSQEYQNRYGGLDDTAFITALFENVLDRPPADSGLAAWLQYMADGASREDVVRAFMDAPEFVTKCAPKVIELVRSFGMDDRIEAGAGNSLLSGGVYADAFVFTAQDDGTHQIIDMEAWDVLELSGFGYATASDALSHITQVGENAVFEDQGVRIVLTDWDAANVTEDMIDIV